MLKRIVLELARTPAFPNGSSRHGYEFIAPLDRQGHLQADDWTKNKAACTVRRFWDKADDETGQGEPRIEFILRIYSDGASDAPFSWQIIRKHDAAELASSTQTFASRIEAISDSARVASAMMNGEMEQ